jgi:hypothetical protein
MPCWIATVWSICHAALVPAFGTCERQAFPFFLLGKSAGRVRLSRDDTTSGSIADVVALIMRRERFQFGHRSPTATA